MKGCDNIRVDLKRKGNEASKINRLFYFYRSCKEYRFINHSIQLIDISKHGPNHDECIVVKTIDCKTLIHASIPLPGGKQARSGKTID